MPVRRPSAEVVDLLQRMFKPEDFNLLVWSYEEWRVLADMVKVDAALRYFPAVVQAMEDKGLPLIALLDLVRDDRKDLGTHAVEFERVYARLAGPPPTRARLGHLPFFCDRQAQEAALSKLLEAGRQDRGSLGS